MKAIIITEPGGPDNMQWQETADPVAGPGEVLVRVRASALNRADTLQRRGLYPPPPGASGILGMEIAGEIISSGSELPAPWEVGQPVMALVSGGAYAEQVTVPVGQLIAKPANLSFEQAAAIPEAFLTAYLNLFRLGDLKAGETVLIHAGGSGIGTAAIQLAHEAGARVLVTAGSDEKLERCRQLGADELVNYRAGSWADRVKDLTGGQGVNLILDFIGADYAEANINSLTLNGRLVLIGQLSGGKASLDLGTIMRKRLHILGTTLRPRSLEDKADLTRSLVEFSHERFVDGRLQPVLDRVFPVEQAAEAHRYMESNASFGKIVLKVQ